MKGSSLLSHKKKYSVDATNMPSRKPISGGGTNYDSNKPKNRQPTHSPYAGASQKKRTMNQPTGTTSQQGIQQ